MSSLSTSFDSSSDLPRSKPVDNTAASMKTGKYPKLENYRQYSDAQPIRHEALALKVDETKDSKHKFSSSNGENSGVENGGYGEKTNTFTSGRMDFEGEAEAEAVKRYQLRSSALLSSNARPSRLAKSETHQKQIHVESIAPSLPKNAALERGHDTALPAGTSSNRCNLEASSSARTFTNVRKASLVSAIFETSAESEHGTHPKQAKLKRRTYSTISTHSSVNPTTLLTRTASQKSDMGNDTRRIKPLRMDSRVSFHSEISQASRDSHETEEDVCFPMFRLLHTRVNGVDFDELEEYAQISNAERNLSLANHQRHSERTYNHIGQDTGFTNSASTSGSSAALKYTPEISRTLEKNCSINEMYVSENNESVREDDKPDLHPDVTFGRNKIEGEKEGNDSSYSRAYYTLQNTEYQIPSRFSFFRSESDETVHASDIPSLISEGQTFYELFKGGDPTWWLDCSCPTDDEMRCIAKTFGIHPLTAEDIRMQETREKVELFKSYYFVCFHTFENDKESENYLEPINVYIVVFRSGVLTFHFDPISHCANVRRRVRQLRDYVSVNSDWLCYALIDDITDSFAPVIQSIEYEADSIDDSVFMTRDMDFAAMLQRIGESRRKTMTLMRLLSGKADVIKMFAKRCQDETNGIGPVLKSQTNMVNVQAEQENVNQNNSNNQISLSNSYMQTTSQPRGDIALYLGDIQDHLLTMFQNLLAYEKIFSRSHANYLAQLQVESFNSNNKVTEMLGKVTMLGTMLVPLNVITGLFGMNVKVPGRNGSIAWWYGILGVLLLLAVISWFLASYWIKKIDPPATLNEAAGSGAKSVISSFLPKRDKRFNDDSKNGDARVSVRRKSTVSLPSRYSRYN